jgi:hypothetical protein
MAFEFNPVSLRKALLMAYFMGKDCAEKNRQGHGEHDGHDKNDRCQYGEELNRFKDDEVKRFGDDNKNKS